MTAKEAFEKLAVELEPAGIKKSKMFAMPVLKLGKKPIAGLDEDGVNFKLKADSPEHKQAMSLEDAHPFQPIIRGKPWHVMKNWVVVPPKHFERYLDLAHASIKVVEEEISGKS